MPEYECDLLDLGSVGKIQPHGFLVCLYFHRDDNKPTCVRNVSSNIVEAPFSLDHLGSDPRLYVGRCISRCFSENAVQTMREMLEQYPLKHSVHSSFVHNNAQYHTTLVTARDGLVFEILPDDERKYNAGSHVRDLHALVEHTDTTRLFESACGIVTSIAGYDRSMVYQFQDDLSGKVIYESIAPSLAGKVDSYMGMYFPESDIPLPARQMYMVRPLRVVYDVDTEPADVIGKDGKGEELPDLSRCTLRANHPVHTNYMKNMGLRSSLSIGIVVDNQLWGLACFHAYGRAVYPKGWVTTFFEGLSLPVSCCLSKIQREDYDRRHSQFSAVVHRSFTTRDVFGYFAQYAPDLLKVLEADCVSIKLGDRIKSWGDADLIMTRSGVEIVAKDAVGKDWAIGELSDPARGLISIVQGDLTVVFIRQSIPTDKIWAGDPSHVKVRRPDGVPGPRGSFARYVQAGVDSRNRWDARDKKLATYVSSRIKLLVATAEFFTRKTNALFDANRTTEDPDTADGRAVEYSVIPDDGAADDSGEASKRPLFNHALISHFSHELKTPIQGISSVLHLIKTDTAAPPAVREFAGDGLVCVEALMQTVNSVLTIAGEGTAGVVKREKLSKRGINNDYANLEKLSIGTFVATLKEEFSNSNSNSNAISITTAVDDEHDEILINAPVLHETVRAIICNSIQNTDGTEETTRVSVSRCSTHREATMAWKRVSEEYSHRGIRNSEEAASRISDSDAWYTFSVQDSGCGIHGDMLDNVLSHHDGTSSPIAVKHSHQGVTIGVYKCISNICFDLSGSVGIASTVSEGTLVSMIVPARAVAVAAPAVKHTQEDVGTILVVDDNTVNRKLAARLVKVACTKRLGVAPIVKQFSDGRLCIEEIKIMRKKGEKIMGILMDYHMPVMSGKEATAHIRGSEASQGLPKIPIFGFTADSSEDTSRELLQSGMDDVLAKPLSMKLLEEACLRMAGGNPKSRA